MSLKSDMVAKKDIARCGITQLKKWIVDLEFKIEEYKSKILELELEEEEAIKVLELLKKGDV